MPDYIFLMHTPTDARPGNHPDWGPYLARLQSSGRFQGGSAIGPGVCVRQSGEAPPVTADLTGFLRVSAKDMEEARSMLVGNPVFEAGGAVEIRELPRTGGETEAPTAPADRFLSQCLNEVVFQDCAMAQARFDDVNLAAASFINVNLRGARFEDVNLSGVTIDNANIQGLTVFGQDIQSLIGRRTD